MFAWSKVEVCAVQISNNWDPELGWVLNFSQNNNYSRNQNNLWINFQIVDNCWVSPASLTLRLRGFSNFFHHEKVYTFFVVGIWRYAFVYFSILIWLFRKLFGERSRLFKIAKKKIVRFFCWKVCVRDFCKNCSAKGPGFFQFLQK